MKKKKGPCQEYFLSPITSFFLISLCLPYWSFLNPFFGMYFYLPSLGDFGQMIEEQNKYSVLAYN